MTTNPLQVTLSGVARTWWPLAASWMFMAAEGPLISAVVARLEDPVVHLAAYGGIVFPLALIIEAPVIMLLAASTALSRDTASYQKVRRYMLWSGGLLTVLHLAVALTPLYDFVVVGLMGAHPSIVEPARIGLLLMTPWTWAIAYRRFNQGALIRFGRSRAVGVGTAVRLATVAAVLVVGYSVDGTGIVVAATAISFGVTAEAVYTRFAVQPVVRGPLAKSEPVSPALTWHAFYAFYIPLALTSFLMLMAQPIGSAAISRMPLSLASLAAWQVVGGLLFLMRSPAVAYNEVVVALADQPLGVGALRRFSAYLAATLTGALVIFLVTPLADLWFEGLIGLTPELAEMARTAMWLGVPLGALTVVQSWYQGVLVNTRKTRGVSEAVAIFLAVDTAVLAGGVILARFSGLYVAVAAMALAAAVQVLWLRYRSRSSFDLLQASPVGD